VPVARSVSACVLALFLSWTLPVQADGAGAAVAGRALSVASGAGGVVISEFVALNGSKKPLGPGGLLDDNGDSSDWIELYNSTDAAIDLKGWYLTDDVDDLTKWEFPACSIAAGQYKVVFASGKNRDDPANPLHTNFQLAGGEGFLALVLPDGRAIADAYQYPQQFGDIAYGFTSTNSTSETVTLVPESAPAQALIPADDALGQSWTAPDFTPTGWLQGKTGVGYGGKYGGYLGLDTAAMRNTNTTAYIRIPFAVSDLTDLEGLKLLMRYDDGFVAYLNGHPVAASANAPAHPQWNSRAAGSHEADAVEEFVLADDSLDYLQLGTNVLAIQGLNNTMTSSDLLILPQLTAERVHKIDLGAPVDGYLLTPTPGRANTRIVADLGPAIRAVTKNPPQPAPIEGLTVTARVTETLNPVSWVRLAYRLDFELELTTPMFDDGQHNDGAAHDGLYGADIPAELCFPGRMLRWYVTAADNQNNLSRNPPFLVSQGDHQSPEYYGTLVQTPGLVTMLSVFSYFVQNTGAEGSRSGTRASVYYLGEFYDNVFVRLRGGYTTHGRKFEFNDGHHFRFDPNLPRVDEFNLNEPGADPTYIRQVLSWETYFNAGQPGCLAFPLHVRRNGSYVDVRIFIEQEDRDMLRRSGLEPDGALYKMYDDLQNGQIDGEGIHRKKTRLDEDAGDLRALAAGVNTTNPHRETYLFDNVNIPAMINYWASTVLVHDNDCTHKNFYAYRDSRDPVNNPHGTNEWMFLPWDKDLTFGLNYGIAGVVADQDWPNDVRSPSHPFFGCSDHQKVDRQWNCVIDALYRSPVVRQMYLRRLRTLMDTLLQPPETPVAQRLFEKRIDELQAQLGIELGNSSWRSNVNRIKTDYLEVRRKHLFVDHSIHNPGYDQNAGIPDAQPDNVTITFGAIEFSPASGNQDEEYIELINPNAFAVDLSGWTLEGAVAHVFPPGTVIPADNGILYVTPDATAFRQRATGPTGGQKLLVQGNYKGHLSSWGETLNLLNQAGALVSTITYEGDPSDQQKYLRLTELMYHPTDGGAFDSEDYEYVEFKNIGNAPLALAGVKFTEGITFTFPDATLPAGGYAVVARDPAAFASRYVVPAGVPVWGPYNGRLSNGGESLKLEDLTSSTIVEFSYQDGWYDETDGAGFSLTLKDPAHTDRTAYGDKAAWRPSAAPGGSPGWDDLNMSAGN
jgi:hypothetical protein